MMSRNLLSIEKLFNIFAIFFITLMPFGIGPTARYLLSLSAIVFSFLILRQHGMGVVSLKTCFSTYVFKALLLWNIFAIISIFFSPEPLYSLRVYFSEFFLNSLLFTALYVLGASTKELPLKWKSVLLWSNSIFLVFYLGSMAIWYLMPGSFFMGDKELIERFISTRTDIIFEFGRTCELFHGIHHTSLYLALMIAFWSVLPFKNILLNLFFLSINFLTLLTTTRRGALLACLLGLIFSQKIVQKQRVGTNIIVGLLLLASITVGVIVSDRGKHFVREDWRLISQGQIDKAKNLGGSIPLRISTYKEFLKEIAYQPFMPRGIGKKLIKEYWKPLIERAGLQHGHNTFINQAFYLGLQGAAALLAIITLQCVMLWKAIKLASFDEKQFLRVALVFIFIYWVTNLFTDAFRHDSASLYWFFTAIATGRALRITRAHV